MHITIPDWDEIPPHTPVPSQPTGKAFFPYPFPEKGSTHNCYTQPKCQVQKEGGGLRKLGRIAQLSPRVEVEEG
jgi:hypothetical protein